MSSAQWRILYTIILAGKHEDRFNYEFVGIDINAYTIFNK